MSRPSQNTDRRLIEAALTLMPKTGLSGLKIRRVAARAGVNLGMFHYHFQDKRHFLNQVMQAYYESFFASFTFEIDREGDPLERLRAALLAVVRFVRDQRRLLAAMGRDLLDGNRDVARILDRNVHRHMRIVVDLVLECQRAGRLRRMPLLVVLPFLLGGLVGPVLIAALAERVRLRPSYELLKQSLIPLALSDKIILERLELALRALEPAPGETARKAGRQARGSARRKAG